MGACFPKTREFGDCGEFQGITEFVCRVIVLSSSEELLKSYITSASRSDNEPKALTLTYRQATTKSLKMQILSIYALPFTSRELRPIHAPFEKLSDRQIKKARSHGKTE